jgi:hypothetical protein
MERVELLTVEDSFQITGRGLVLVPTFCVPNGWKNRTGPLVVVRPDGQQYEATAQFNMVHFNISDPNVPLDKRWQIEVVIEDRKKDELPIGSRILVAPDLKDAIVGDRKKV